MTARRESVEFGMMRPRPVPWKACRSSPCGSRSTATQIDLIKTKQGQPIAPFGDEEYKERVRPWLAPG
jgi:hypothetical protein